MTGAGFATAAIAHNIRKMVPVLDAERTEAAASSNTKKATNNHLVAFTSYFIGTFQALLYYPYTT